MGYEAAGFRFLVQVELLKPRAEIGQKNFPGSEWLIRDVVGAASQIAATFKEKAGAEAELDLLVATPPCQGMSSSNPSRGKRKDGCDTQNDRRNRLILEMAQAGCCGERAPGPHSEGYT